MSETTKAEKDALQEKATFLVTETLEKGHTLAEAATIFDAARAKVRELVFDRLRKIEAETGQLKMIVGDGPKQRASDRFAEDQVVLDAIERTPATAMALSTETKAGARIHAILARLLKKGLVCCSGKGPAAVWDLGPLHPTKRKSTPPAPPAATPPASSQAAAAPPPAASMEAPAAAPAPPPAASMEAPAPATTPATPPKARRGAAAAVPAGPVPRPPSPDEDWTT